MHVNCNDKRKNCTREESVHVFSVYHFIWIGICVTLIAASLIYIDKKHISLKQLLPVCCVISVVSEVIKTFSVFKMVPSADGSTYFPYLELQYLPLHMCSLLIFVIFYITYGKNEKWKSDLTGFLYAAGILGGILGICLPSIFSSAAPEKSFVNPLAYQTFIFHSMVIVLGVTIYRDKDTLLTPRHFKTTILFAAVLTFLSLYINSIFAVPVYENSVLQSVEYITNFFFTYRTPIGLSLTTKEQWYIYLAAITVIAVVLIFLLYLPIFKREKKH